MIASNASLKFTKTSKKPKNVQKLAKPKNDLSAVSKFKNGGAAAYWGYKAFQSLRVCSGDVTALAEIATELLGGGLCAGAVANPGMVVEAVEAVVNAQGGIKAFRKNVKNFAQFSAALSKQLNSDGKTQTNGQTMESAEHLYNMFMKCDHDGSGTISLEEYIVFSAREGVPRDMAEMMFFQADIDGNGQISFEEWTAMMVGRVGRDKNSFNCAGHHGLTPYVAVCNGMACDFCGTPIRAGDLAKGCRRCDCDACASCSGPPSTGAVPPPPPPRPVVKPASSSKKKKQPSQSPGTRPASAAARPGERPRTFDCRMQHGLASRTVNVGHTVVCDWCGAVISPGQLSFGCRACDTDGCVNCAVASLRAPDGNASGLTCRGRHGLAWAPAGVGCVCDFCRAPVAAGAEVYSCRACGVDACVACVWKDHRRALSTGGAFACENFKTHVSRPLHIATPEHLNHRCNWCMGAPSLGHTMMRCDLCDCDVCALCMATVPDQEAKVQRARAATLAAQRVATDTNPESSKRLGNLSISGTAGPPIPPPRPAGGSPSQPALTQALPPPPALSQALPPPPCYGSVAAPAYGGQAAAEEPALPSYGATAGLFPAGCPSGHVAEAPALPSYDAMAGPSPAEAPSYQDMATVSTVPGAHQEPPSYSSFAGAVGGNRGGSSPNPADPPPPAASASCSPERETPTPTATAADGAGSPF